MCLGTAGTVVALHEIAGVTMAIVEFPFAPTQNCLSYVDSLVVGERVLVSGGAVLERVTEEEACERASFGAALLAAWDRIEPRSEGRSEDRSGGRGEEGGSP